MGIKSLQESAADILNKSKANAHADPMQKLDGASFDDLGGEDGSKANQYPDLDPAKKISKIAKRPADKDSPQDPRKGLKSVSEAEEEDDKKDDDDDSSGGDDDGDKKKPSKDKDEVDVKEENLEELSKKTLSSYVKKASSSITDRNDLPSSLKKRDDKRVKGISKASDKLAKEEVETEVTNEDLVDFSVELGNLFEGTDLSEEFKTNVATIFEAAVEAKYNTLAETLTEAFDKAFNEAVEEMQTNLNEQVESYMNHVAEEWLSENVEVVERSIRNELTEDFIVGLRNLFIEHYIEVPEERLEIYEDLYSKYEEVVDQYNAVADTNIQLTNALKEERKKSLVTSKILESRMTDVAASEYIKLVEELEYKNDDDFDAKLETVFETYFKKTPVKTTNLNEDSLSDNEQSGVVETTGPMNNYVSAISRGIRK